MIVLPIINRDRILNIKVELKDAHKIVKKTNDINIKPSDIMVNHNKYSESSYSNSVSTSKTVMEFIRSNSKISKNSILVSTKMDQDGNYDIYEIMFPGEKVSDGIDNLIGSIILDLKNESVNQKGRYIDLNKIDVFDIITKDKLEKLVYLRDNLKYINLTKYIDENDLRPLFNLVQIMDKFNFTVISKSVIALEKFMEVNSFLEPTNSKDYNSLNNYLEIAKENKNEYSKLSYLYKTVNNKPLDIIHTSHEKVKVYSSEHNEEAS